ncbi:MAG TPA: ABC transporter permease [Pelolinea sp.]|nr:ABC transporter permease [Pelolinea sp.]
MKKTTNKIITLLNDIKEKSAFDGQMVLLVGIFTVLMVFFTIMEDGFMTERTFSSMGFQIAEIGLLALAMMVSILIGGINLSINATANLGAVLAGYFLFKVFPPVDTGEIAQIFTQINFPAEGGNTTIYILIAILIPILVGILTGVINGYLVGYLSVPAILATLASLSLFTGISTGLTKGRTITGFPPNFELIGAKTISGIPIPFIIFLVMTVVTYFLLNHTTLGFKMKMLGTNPTASEFSGINNRAVIMQTYIYSGILSAIAGIIVMSRTMSAAYEYGSKTYLLFSILIAVLAGMTPGFGNVINVFISVLILQILSTGFHMVLLGVRGSSFFKDFSWGILLIIIFIFNYFVRGRKAQE